MESRTPRRRVLVLGAAGRDFHNFNTVYRGDPRFDVVAFTATQIPGVSNRAYPPALAGRLYPAGIPILDEAELDRICREEKVDEVVFSYSDVSHEHVMHLASRALATGADFTLLGPDRTMLRSRHPVIAVSAVRTGCGKSQIARWISNRLRGQGFKPAALRHPMPYGDLLQERVQRFATMEDIAAAKCTVEEREEYEPHVAAGSVIFAGVDYAAILERADAEANIIIWDGGNNDFPFIRPDLHIVVADALRPKHLDTHHPGETVLRMADIIVINKTDAATADAVQQLSERAARINPRALIVRGASPVRLDNPAAVKGRRVLVVDDGPTLTHGGMAYGAGYVAAVAAGAGEIVDPRLSADPDLQRTFASFPHLRNVLPAMGYSEGQVAALRRTIEQSDAEIVVAGTPIDLAALIKTDKPIVRARYEYAESGEPSLGSLIDAFLTRQAAGRTARGAAQ